MQETSALNTRTFFIAAISSLLAFLTLAATVISLYSLKPDVAMLSNRITAERTAFFFHTIDRAAFETGIQASLGIFTSAASSRPPRFPEGASYAFAILRPESGSTKWKWVADITMANGKHDTLFSENEPTTLLPLQENKQSLMETTSLQQFQNQKIHTIGYIPLTQKIAVDTPLQAILAPFSEAIFLSEGSGGQIVLTKKQAGTFGKHGAILSTANEKPLFSLAMNGLPSILQTVEEMTQKQDPALAEGIEGIAKATLVKQTQSSDLQRFITDALQNQTTVSLIGSGTTLHFVATTQMRNKDALRYWSHAVESAKATALIRTQTFAQENSRIDIIAKQDAEKVMKDDWALSTMHTDARTKMFVATRNTTVMISDAEDLLLRSIHQLEQQGLTSSPHFAKGNVNLRWLQDQPFPLLGKKGQALLKNLVPETGDLWWEATDHTEKVILQYSVSGRGGEID